MARTYYHKRTESNAAAYDAQKARAAFWNPILDFVANVGAFVAFVVYCLLGVAGVAAVGVIVYMIVGGVLSVFGVDIFPADFLNG